MLLEREQLNKIVHSVITTLPEEIGCDDCFDQLEQYAELILADREIPLAMRLLQDHIACCRGCREEFEALLAALGNVV